jgi:hypothetical protein
MFFRICGGKRTRIGTMFRSYTGSRSQLINRDKTLSKFLLTSVALEGLYVRLSEISRLWFQE